MKRLALLFSFFGVLFSSYGQEIVQFETIFGDSFKEWRFTFVENSFEENSSTLDGEISLSWGMSNRWDEYIVNLDGFRSRINLNVVGTMFSFELHNDDNENMIAKRVWPRDLSEWKISHEQSNYEVKVLNPNDPEEWIITKDNKVLCNILTEFQGDPRNWIIDYKSPDIIPQEIQKLAIVIIIHIVCPKI